MQDTAVKVKESTGYIAFKVINTVFMIFICVVTLYPFLYLQQLMHCKISLYV